MLLYINSIKKKDLFIHFLYHPYHRFTDNIFQCRFFSKLNNIAVRLFFLFSFFFLFTKGIFILLNKLKNKFISGNKYRK